MIFGKRGSALAFGFQGLEFGFGVDFAHFGVKIGKASFFQLSEEFGAQSVFYTYSQI